MKAYKKNSINDETFDKLENAGKVFTHRPVVAGRPETRLSTYFWAADLVEAGGLKKAARTPRKASTTSAAGGMMTPTRRKYVRANPY